MRRFLLLLIPMLFLVGCGVPQPANTDSQPAVQPDSQPDLKPVDTTEILVFTAKWCHACQRDKPRIKELQESGVKVTIIDVDEHPELARKYRIKTLPTYIVLDNGVEVQRTGDIFLILSIVSLILKYVVPIVWPLLFG